MTRASAVLVLLLAAPARAFVLGGGDPDKDCRLAFEGVEPNTGASGVVCVDGDPACDSDGAQDGFCRFDVRVCAGVNVAGCNPVQIDRIEVGGELLGPPMTPTSPGECGAASGLEIPAGGTAAATTLRGYRNGELVEVDYLNLCCVTGTSTLTAAACSVGFDPAASGCGKVPKRALRKAGRARTLVAQAGEQPGAALRLLHKARKQMRRLRSLGQKLARRNDCGFALGLMGGHGADVIGTTAP